MPLTGDIPTDEIRELLREATEEKIRQALRVLAYVGEVCVNEAREHGNYTDRTGNLRSSIGYVVVRDGEVVSRSSFEKVLETADAGPEAGSTLAAKLASEVGTNQLALIVVAGMKYAIYVTSKGRNVINSAESEARYLVPLLMKQLNENWKPDNQ